MTALNVLRCAGVLLCAGLLAPGSSPYAADASTSRPNVLFIAVDDLNHWVGHLGRHPQTKTPNIDRLAAQGMTFTRAYCAAPICNPSRTALLTGRRPSSTGVYDNRDPMQRLIQESDSLISTFKKAGYETRGAGKIFHGGGGWSSQWDDYAGNLGHTPAPTEDRSIGPIKFGPVDCADEKMGDHAIASYALEQLAQKRGKPLFLAIGFHKPHMPWNVPRKYYDLHPLDKIELPPYREDDLEDLPKAGVNMAKAFGDHERVLQSGRWKEAVQGYLAAISFVDAQVGRLLEGLQRSPSATNTVVCFWGDHGWHLGEKHHWRKFALWEEATRAPLIWVVPGMTQPGGRCERVVDFMTVYPTLCGLASVPAPPHLEGSSLARLLANPQAEWSQPALTTHGFMNHAVRTDRWRYIRYADGGEELYDEQTDPYEWTNLAAKDTATAVKKSLAQWFPVVNKPGRAGPAGGETSEAFEPEKKPNRPKP